MKLKSTLLAVAAGAMLQGPVLAQQGEFGASSNGRLGQDSAMDEHAGMSVDSSVIMDAQQALNDHGYDAGPVDGIYGPMTQSALRDFQQDNDLDATGRFDEDTLAALGIDTGVGATTSPQVGDEPTNGIGQPGAGGEPSFGDQPGSMGDRPSGSGGY